MQYRVDHFLPKAFEALQKVQLQKNENGRMRNIRFIDSDHKIPKEYKGYISSLGANIVQAGVKAAIAFYQAEESGSKSDRRLVNAAIKYIISANPILNNDDKYHDFNLLEDLENQNGNPMTGEQVQTKAMEILDAATALKLALRTYKLK